MVINDDLLMELPSGVIKRGWLQIPRNKCKFWAEKLIYQWGMFNCQV
jgi:hypothetical protein